MNAEQFRKLLSTHDWYYHYSDDHSVWRRGEASSRAINAAMRDNDALKALYKQYREDNDIG